MQIELQEIKCWELNFPWYIYVQLSCVQLVHVHGCIFRAAILQVISVGVLRVQQLNLTLRFETT